MSIENPYKYDIFTIYANEDLIIKSRNTERLLYEYSFEEDGDDNYYCDSNVIDECGQCDDEQVFYECSNGVYVCDLSECVEGCPEGFIENPEYVGNQDYPANTIKIRVSANDTNAMEAGVFAVISSAFTQDSGKPVAATNGVVDDINDSFDWDYVPGFETVDYYEISTDAGETWGGANTKPSLIQAGEFGRDGLTV